MQGTCVRAQWWHQWRVASANLQRGTHCSSDAGGAENVDVAVAEGKGACGDAAGPFLLDTEMWHQGVKLMDRTKGMLANASALGNAAGARAEVGGTMRYCADTAFSFKLSGLGGFRLRQYRG